MAGTRDVSGRRSRSLRRHCISLFSAACCRSTAVNIIDTAFALMVIPTLTATIPLAPRVVEEMRRYFRELG